MSLVAYGASSDDESEVDEEIEEADIIVKSKAETSEPEDEENANHLKLPAPKAVKVVVNIEEEDDEFLRKKAVPTIKPTHPKITKNGKVQISIPSLRDFKDVEKKKKQAPMIGAALPNKSTGLLDMLPKPKSTSMFSTMSSSAPSSSAPGSSKTITNNLIPDSVANRRKNIVPEAKPKAAADKKNKTAQANYDSADSGDDDDGKNDFFSFNSEHKLPEISSNEINAMVAKRAAQMAESANRYDEKEPEIQPEAIQVTPYTYNSESVIEEIVTDKAMQSLIGGNKAKRAKMNEVNIIDISSSDIIPSKEEYNRQNLQRETGYVPTGTLVGDWTCTSKRKSHVTYLAYKAKANEEELEAMWSQNRQTRRQTQSKYGF